MIPRQSSQRSANFQGSGVILPFYGNFYFETFPFYPNPISQNLISAILAAKIGKLGCKSSIFEDKNSKFGPKLYTFSIHRWSPKPLGPCPHQSQSEPGGQI